MNYVLQYRDNGTWRDWGFRTSDKTEIEKKLKEARLLVAGKVKLRYVMRG